jgi:hypothetical protein
MLFIKISEKYNLSEIIFPLSRQKKPSDLKSCGPLKNAKTLSGLPIHICQKGK